MPNSIMLKVFGDKAYGITAFEIAMREKRPVTDFIAGYTFHAYGQWFQIVR